MEPFKLHEAQGDLTPIIVSVPHSGTDFPDEVKEEFNPSLIQRPDDTDWFVDQLYDFVPSLGITLISAVYSRWVIDLNRDPQSKPLYTDGRIITALCPTTTFLGEPLYHDNRKDVDPTEVKRRLDLYYYPYHKKIQSLLDERKKRFGKVLLWDCHSIRQIVPTIQKEKFPDLILGDADEQSASKTIIQTALTSLSSGKYSVNHNSPFKGGTITRSFGKPQENQHALQLEMCKVHYMDDAEIHYHKERSSEMRRLLRATFEALIEKLA